MSFDPGQPPSRETPRLLEEDSCVSCSTTWNHSTLGTAVTWNMIAEEEALAKRIVLDKDQAFIDQSSISDRQLLEWLAHAKGPRIGDVMDVKRTVVIALVKEIMALRAYLRIGAPRG